MAAVITAISSKSSVSGATSATGAGAAAGGFALQGDILERFLKTPPFRFNISLYGGNNETYSRMCGIPAYDRVKENIRKLRQAGVEVSLNLSITPYNKDDIEQIYADAAELDVNVKATSYMYPPVRINGEQYGCSNRLPCSESAKYSVQWDAIRFTPEEFDQWKEEALAMGFKYVASAPLVRSSYLAGQAVEACTGVRTQE